MSYICEHCQREVGHLEATGHRVDCPAVAAPSPREPDAGALLERAAKRCEERATEIRGVNNAVASAHVEEARDLRTLAARLRAGEPTYACDDCGTLRTKDEGGTVFTVCDECWNKHFRSAASPEAGPPSAPSTFAIAPDGKYTVRTGSVPMSITPPAVEAVGEDTKADLIDLATMIRRLCYALRDFGHDQLVAKAIELLRRKGLEVSSLRAAGTAQEPTDG